MDAEGFVFPGQPLVLYLFNPFSVEPAGAGHD